jgi:PAS domain S-box-containing protein
VLAADPSRQIAAILALQDISDRKHAEDALRASQQRLEQAEQIAATGTWEWDLRSGQVSWSSGLYRIFMLHAEDLPLGFEEGITRHVFPADREALRETLQRAVAERSSVALEFRAIRADGRVRVLGAQAEVVVDDDGEPARMIAVVHDMTEARLAQQALESASSQLADRARELQQLSVGSQAQARHAAPASELSERQLQVLQLVAQGMTNALIAQRLFISETTVKWHIRKILTKTSSSNRAEAVANVLGARTP